MVTPLAFKQPVSAHTAGPLHWGAIGKMHLQSCDHCKHSAHFKTHELGAAANPQRRVVLAPAPAPGTTLAAGIACV